MDEFAGRFPLAGERIILSQLLHGIMARFASADMEHPRARKFTFQGYKHN
jgi:hypothetical protein